ESYDGPSLILAYSPCIAHGIDMRKGLEQQYAAVNSGHWPLMRYNPVIRDEGGNPFLLDSPRPRIPLKAYHEKELRFRMLQATDPDEAARLLELGQEQVNRRWQEYERMASETADAFATDAR
ncbi:MAG TPA: pyruvate:ferredoxin (flavodoxin) oxidoreductase, partial [Propionibacteriaceae bacterium]|nr:pyruvate:ferredoxin (flavodoxin) oxidoreductase [Propionibacteriaceae bacterium]